MGKLRIPPFYTYAQFGIGPPRETPETKDPRAEPQSSTLTLLYSTSSPPSPTSLTTTTLTSPSTVLELLVQVLHRLNDSDPDDFAAVYPTLATIENLIEVELAVAELICEKTKLMKWLLEKIKGSCPKFSIGIGCRWHPLASFWGA
ncbi:hypothetical protein HN51_038226 [Arachis hypogaea]